MTRRRRTCRTLAVAEVRHAVAHAVAVPWTLLAAVRGRLRGACTRCHTAAAETPTLTKQIISQPSTARHFSSKARQTSS